MSMMITIANRKGGVGKTTLAIALAETFVFEHRKNTVILDLDPQSSATEILLSVDEYADRLEADNVLPGYLRSALAGVKRPAEKFLSHARHSLNGRGSVDMALVPNSPEMWDAEFAALRAGSEAQYREAMRALFDHLQTEFDVIIVDNPPGKTMASEEAILAFEELERTQTVPPWRFVISRLGGNYAEANKQVDVIKARYQDHFLTERKGLPGFGHTELVGLPQAQRIVQRIAMFRESPDTVKTLEGFYGADATQQLRKIAQKLQEVPEAHA